MPLVRSALIATAACLIGAAAYAQPSSTDQSAAPPAASSDMNAPAATPPSSDMNGQTGASAQAPAGASVGSATNTSATVDANGNQVIASAPVPDTPANRAAYGQPLSRAGRRTKPAGN